jgi:hypothetical protein
VQALREKMSDDYLKFWTVDQNDPNAGRPGKTVDDVVVRSLVQTRHTDGLIGVLKQCHVAEFDIAIHPQKTHEEVEALNLSVI